MRRRGHEDVASKDVYLNGFALVAVVAYLLLMLINPIAKDETAKPTGKLMISIAWPDGDSDVDGHVYSDGEDRPIGFNNRTGTYWSLSRDDRGDINDPMPANFEHFDSRAIPVGRTTFNLHCFRCGEGLLPIPVGIEIRIVIDGVARVLLQTNVTLIRNRQELTVVSFELTDKGQIVPGSAHSVFKPLYEDWGQ